MTPCRPPPPFECHVLFEWPLIRYLGRAWFSRNWFISNLLCVKTPSYDVAWFRTCPRSVLAQKSGQGFSIRGPAGFKVHPSCPSTWGCIFIKKMINVFLLFWWIFTLKKYYLKIRLKCLYDLASIFWKKLQHLRVFIIDILKSNVINRKFVNSQTQGI